MVKTEKFWTFVFLGFVLLLHPVTVFGQVNSGNSNYEPQSGQSGKDVVWVPTPHQLVDVMIRMANLTSNDYLVDLGSGDGRIVIAAAKKGIKAAGVEFNPDLIEFSKKNAKSEGVADKTEFVQADFFEYDMSKATVITMFLLTDINRRLKPTLLELKPGTRIITNTFSIDDWNYDEKEELNDNSISWKTAYMWIVPAKVEGTWKFEGGEMTLAQTYQKVTGIMKIGNISYPITDGRLRGDVLSFTCNSEFKITCTVNNRNMKGTSEREGKSRPWEATKQ
ncbi:MAG: methyltransferase domain-containing protein [Tannerella sp.]|jgi:precorrin-6B methylase 2|nr:methyltransferase domain-containing protein [Tannerella sp.]